MAKPGWKERATLAKVMLRAARWEDRRRAFFRKLARKHRLNAGDMLLMLYDLFSQAMFDMTMDDKQVDTMARSAYARVAKFFEKLGLVKKHHEFGRVFLGEFVPIEELIDGEEK